MVRCTIHIVYIHLTNSRHNYHKEVVKFCKRLPLSLPYCDVYRVQRISELRIVESMLLSVFGYG
jgi:hypothetical protein